MAGTANREREIRGIFWAGEGARFWLQVFTELKCRYLATRSLDPTDGGRTRWVMRWRPARKAHWRFPTAGGIETTPH